MKPECRFCKNQVEDMYKIVDGNVECIRCYVWLEQKKQEEQQEAA